MIQEQNPVRQQIPWSQRGNHPGDNYAEGPVIKVRCTHPQGIYYDFRRRREGDVFLLIPQYVAEYDDATMRPKYKDGKPILKLVTAAEQFNPAKMEKVDDDLPETITTAQSAINKASDELNGEKLPRRR